MSIRFSLLPLAVSLAVLSGCSTIAEKTTFISDDQIKSKVAGTLGTAPGSVEILSRRTAGTDTYVEARIAGKKMYACTLNGGSLLTAGIINPPTCNPK